MSYFSSSTGQWNDASGEDDASIRQTIENELLTGLQMYNLVVLAGCGTSISAGGPSMEALWENCIKSKDAESQFDQSEKLRYCRDNSESNIELFLSLCEASMECEPDLTKKSEIDAFIKDCRNTIRSLCRDFLLVNESLVANKNVALTSSDPETKVESHRSLLCKLTRRRVRAPRLKVFTTNYDICFEYAASNLGLIVIDGFSFTYPHTFDPRYFDYDMVKRSRSSDERGEYLEGVFHLYKLHGSVNWHFTDNRIEKMDFRNQDGITPCMIYPAKGKFQQSYAQPYIETISRFMATLREPNTCLLVLGFGFNDDHLSEPILAAVQSNPHLKVVIVDLKAKENYPLQPHANNNRFRFQLSQLASKGMGDIMLVNVDFQQFVGLIPDLKALSQGEKIVDAIRDIARNTP